MLVVKPQFALSLSKGNAGLSKARDSLMLAGLAHTGEPTPIYVRDAADEAIRDLVRARAYLIVTLFVGTKS